MWTQKQRGATCWVPVGKSRIAVPYRFYSEVVWFRCLRIWMSRHIEVRRFHGMPLGCMHGIISYMMLYGGPTMRKSPNQCHNMSQLWCNSTNPVWIAAGSFSLNSLKLQGLGFANSSVFRDSKKVSNDSVMHQDWQLGPLTEVADADVQLPAATLAALVSHIAPTCT